ncbi:hypothetical protein [Anaerophilus nitritogenes]|nr:hypothetical protein [Anaerophilus nitritogenes]
MKKNFLSLFLVLTFVFTLSITSFADYGKVYNFSLVKSELLEL